MAAVEFCKVTKRFGSVTAVDDFNLVIPDGEFVVLLGPSGCGKSTVLRLLAGLDAPTDGTISIDGRSVAGVDPKDRDVAMVFQSYALYPHMTVEENIAFPLRPRRVGRSEAARRVRDAAAQLGLVDLLDRRPAQLSGGQRQRVALARAIVRQPRVFLMDEPLSNLDAQLRSQTRAELVALHRRLRTTFLYVTHDQTEALTMADRVAVLHRGRLQQVGPPQEVYDRPANLTVARFVGAPPMNLLPGTLDPSTGVVQVGGTTLPAPAGVRERFSAGPSLPVHVGVRPERIRLAGADAGVAPRLSLKVELVEELGHEELIHGTVEGGGRLVARQPADRRRGGAIAVGSTLALTFDLRDVHLFDAVTEARIDE